MIQRIVSAALRMPFIVFSVAVLLVLLGYAAYSQLDIEAYPNPCPPLVEVLTQPPGWSAEETERYVTIPLEIGLSGMPGLDHIRSFSLFALSDVKVYFKWTLEYKDARQEVINRLQFVQLPAGLQGQLSPWNAIGEVFRYRVVGKGYTLKDLKTAEDWVLERQFKQVQGVIDVTSYGGQSKEYHVEVDPYRLRGHNVPPAQGCCGALSLHSGRAAEAARFAAQTIAGFERAGVDAIVVNSAGCGSAMKEYGGFFARTADGERDGLAARAAAFSGRVRDFSEFLAELYRDHGGPRAVRHELKAITAYHDACHLAHAQGIKQQPRDLLDGIPGLDLIEVGGGGTCCGSAGIYNLVQPEAAAELGQRKAAAIRATGARLVVSANPGCSLQIAAALAADGGDRLLAAHIAEVLDASFRGLPLSALGVGTA